ncbi:MAG: ABC transporter permease [Acidimicrobiia bacterium]|nr:MAG: ABC transporter permease [Acidimicrobiia bacterium]
MTALTPALPARRRGAVHWWRGYASMVRWELVRMRALIPMTMIVQVFTGAGAVIGFGLLIPDLSPTRALYLSSGAVVITLTTIGLVMGPQLIAQQRLSGQFDYMQSLPTPSSATAAAWTSVNVVVAVPGAMAALLVAMWRYDLQFDLAPYVVPALLLILASGTLIGQSIAVAVPNPRVVNVIAQLLIFITFGFSPISFPAEHLPEWLQAVHRWLPFESMADLTRAGLTSSAAIEVGRGFLLLSVWTVLATLVLGVVLRRRA